MLDFCSITPALIWHHTVSDSEQQTAASSSLFMICLLLLWRLPKMSSRRLRDACPDRPLWNQFGELITGSTPQPYLPQQTIDYLSTPCVTLILVFFAFQTHEQCFQRMRSGATSPHFMLRWRERGDSLSSKTTTETFFWIKILNQLWFCVPVRQQVVTAWATNVNAWRAIF